MELDLVEIGNRIKKAREARNMTLDDIASEIGVAKSTIQRYEASKISSPKLPVLHAIANALSVDPSWLSGEDVPMEKKPEFPDNIHPIAKKRLPLYDGIACGEPRLVPDGIELYIDATTDIQADYVLKCHGDSMTGARIHDGDLVFIRSQPMVENGEIAAVMIDDSATLKRVYKYRDLLVLRAENPAYKDIELSGEELKTVRILGKAVAFQSDVK